MAQNLKSVITKIKKAEKGNKKKNTKELNILIKYLKEISKVIDKYDEILFFIQPRGKNYVSYEKEFSVFLKKIKINHQYCPVFTYPEIEKIDIKNINIVALRLNKIKEKAKKEYVCDDVHEIIFELLEIAEAKVCFLKKLKLKNFKKAFEFSKIIYGDIDKELYRKANEAYKEKLKFLKNRPDKSELEKKLEKISFNETEVKKYFELALKKTGLNNNYKVFIDGKISSVKINEKDPEHCCPVISIPSEIEVNGIRLMQLIAHEIGKHATTNYCHKKQGLAIEIGRNWNVYNEGLAKRNENDIKKIMLGSLYMDSEIDFSMYYILAIEKIKKGWNFNKVYKYIYEKCYKENLYECDYYSKKKLDKRAELEKESEKKSIDLSKKICMRVFRGFNPKNGEMYFPKDKIYFEGEVMIQELNKIKHRKKLEKYLYLSRADVKYVPALIKIGAYKYEKDFSRMKEIAERLWNNKEFRESILNYKKIRGNIK
ncbi:MAG: DUF1704 domain-containing protein [Candidatus Pacebacteria bacterium]|nr:DUF1704 domain-containing protein [Candidatus Paceibacterota bacterium]